MTPNDIIPDIHAGTDRLRKLLSTMRYVAVGQVWEHQEGRIAAFLRDFIEMDSCLPARHS